MFAVVAFIWCALSFLCVRSVCVCAQCGWIYYYKLLFALSLSRFCCDWFFSNVAIYPKQTVGVNTNTHSINFRFTLLHFFLSTFLLVFVKFIDNAVTHKKIIHFFLHLIYSLIHTEHQQSTECVKCHWKIADKQMEVCRLHELKCFVPILK